MRLSYVHRFRGLAILLIIAIHCIGLFDWSRTPGIEQTLNMLFGDATVLFVFIAGFLFQHLSARFRYRDYLRRKLRNVLLPYLLMGVPAVLYVVVTRPDEPFFGGIFYSQPVPLQVLGLYLTGRMLTPYWFMPMIAIIFALAPLFIAVDRRPALYWAIVPLVGLAVMLHRPLYNADPIQSFVYFLPVYLAGMAASHYREAMFAIIARWGWAMWLAVAALSAAKLLLPGTDGVIHGHFGMIGDLAPDLLLLQKLLLAPLLLDLLRRMGGGPRILDRLADISFGLYFVHFYVIMVIGKVLAETRITPEGGLLAFLACVAVVTLVSGLMIEAVRGTAGTRSRVLIGS